jgi:hypothetical protein
MYPSYEEQYVRYLDCDLLGSEAVYIYLFICGLLTML